MRDVGTPPTSASALRCGMDVVSLGWRTDLMVRRLAGSVVEDRGDHIVVSTPANPGFHFGNLLLLAEVPAEAEVAGWLARFRDTFPYAEHVAFGIDGAEGRVGSWPGLQVEVDIVLTATELPSRPSSPAMAIRTLVTDKDWQQTVALELVCHGDDQSPGHALFVQRRVDEQRALALAGHGAWFGAFPDGTLRASLGLVSDGRGFARYQNVQTQPEFRRQGLATQLVHEAGVYGLSAPGVPGARDAQTLVIVADPDDVAIRIYRSLGFVDRERQVQLWRAPQPRD